MKIKQYTKEQLERKISKLESLRGTKWEKNSDKRYIKAYKAQLEEKSND